MKSSTYEKSKSAFFSPSSGGDSLVTVSALMPCFLALIFHAGDSLGDSGQRRFNGR